jgi:hypothetical protein
MSNSGRIGGKKKSATHKMVRSKEKVDECGGEINRTHRRAYAAMARKNKDVLDEASILAVKYYNGDVEAAKSWLYAESDGFSPLERILTGDGALVLKQLKEMLSIIPDEVVRR